eukprot:CAMPEP_0117513100 /NCGR_PEP_ID=MMETSP0784-20121206/29375_1 /TAXON_ID=39447 /ORGANISM="" /LENGTH=322 /DNA_ID=CAMNT_0005308845 /DNA_START=37 /DNA_END=1005 /DNA_ORIENTATION=-
MAERGGHDDVGASAEECRDAPEQESEEDRHEDSRESPDEDSDEEGNQAFFAARDAMIPSYPFPSEFSLDVQGSEIQAIRHLCRRHPNGTCAIVLFFPGVHGGVGPCRQPGNNFDEAALYASVSRRIIDNHDADIDIYRCSWPFMRPRISYAVRGACRMLHHAMLQAMSESSKDEKQRELDIFFVGHSLGGAVALQAAVVVATRFGTDGLQGQHMEGLERAVVKFRGLCTLNGAVDVERHKSYAENPFAPLSDSRALLVCGDADSVVPPESTAHLYEALPMRDKRHLVLEGATHDLFTHKEQLVEELTTFILGKADRCPSTEA